MHVPRLLSKPLPVPVILVAMALFAVGAAWAGTAGQNGKIVFVGGDAQSGNFQLFTINPDGSDKVQLTNLAPNNFDSLLPNISPDGQRIVFCFGNFATANPFANLYIINIDGSGLRQVTNDGLSCFPRWSPDGKGIALVGYEKTVHIWQVG